MPFLAKALLDNRKRFERRAAEIEEKLFELNHTPAVTRPREGYACSISGGVVPALTEDVRAQEMAVGHVADFAGRALSILPCEWRSFTSDRLKRDGRPEICDRGCLRSAARRGPPSVCGSRGYS